MTKNIVSAAAVLLGAGALLASCNFEQPSSGCIVQDASFANWVAKYDLKPNQTISAECQTRLIIGQNATYQSGGEILGVFKFTDPNKPGSSILTLRPQGLYSRALLDPNNEGDPETGGLAQTAVGSLADETGADDFCATGGPDGDDWTVAKVEPRPPGQVRPEVPPTTTISYQFKNVKVYAAPDAPGTQLTGDLIYTRDGCTAEYTVRAMWPAVGCNPDSQKASERCEEGSGINPEFAVVCDLGFRVNNTRDPPNTGPFVFPGSCVPAKEIPSFTEAR